MATTALNTFDTQHDDMIHDAQLDYYGKRLATCSSDRTIRIFDVATETQQQLGVLKGHEGPVWQVAWAHPKFGSILASCSYDSSIFIWKETNGVWSKLKELNVHGASVNSVSWAPHEYGLILASASSDGKICVSKYQDDGTWQTESFHAHAVGVNAVSWAPSAMPGSLVTTAGANASLAPKRLVSGGCDNFIKIWVKVEGAWKEEANFEGHNDWVRDVSWAPNIGLPNNYIASCSQDKTVIVWTQDMTGGAWTKKPLTKDPFPDVIWRVSWAPSGNILAVSCGDNKVSLWKENLEGQFQQVGDVNDVAQQ